MKEEELLIGDEQGQINFWTAEPQTARMMQVRLVKETAGGRITSLLYRNNVLAYSQKNSLVINYYPN